MNGRECITNILNRRGADRLSWTTVADAAGRSLMPRRLRECPVLEFYRAIGCDILQFGNAALAADQCAAMPYRRVAPCTVETAGEGDGTWRTRTVCRWGTLESAWRAGHPVKYPIATPEDLACATALWRETLVEEAAAPAAEESLARVQAAIGDDGIYMLTLEPSPVQQLIEMDIGLENFYYLLADRPREVEALMDAMHAVRMAEYRIIARRMDVAAVCPVENTSTTLTSPAIYERYSLGQIADLVDVMHEHDRKVVLHMCGRLEGLLGLIARTGADAINALTPPSVGDVPPERALDVLGEDVVLLGTIFNPNVFQKPRVTREEIWRELDRLYTPRLRKAHMVLWLGCDGLATELYRFEAVRQWMEA
ncbi:MAG: uroporphyrinogen decarboxylase family protein [Planctomycetaceae bacterium]|nr:hypothetical protein [Planctomycetaceae bacterium]